MEERVTPSNRRFGRGRRRRSSGSTRPTAYLIHTPDLHGAHQELAPVTAPSLQESEEMTPAQELGGERNGVPNDSTRPGNS